MNTIPAKNKKVNQVHPKGRFDVRCVVAIFLLAVCIRGLYLYDSSDNPTFGLPVVDSRTYDSIARDVTERGLFTQDLFWQAPFYPLFLSAVYLVTGGSILAAKIFQMFLAGVTCVLVYFLGVRIFNRRIGLFAGILAAMYMPLVFYDGELLATGWAAFWSVLLVIGFIRTAEKPDPWHCFFLGLLGGLGTVTRPVFLPFFIAGSIWFGVTATRHLEMKKLLLRAMAIGAGFLTIAIPTGLLGYQTTGKFRILPFSGGINLYIGNNPNYKETITIRPGLQWENLLKIPAAYGIESIYKKDEFFRKKTIEYALNKPVDFIKGLAYKTSQFFSSREIPRNTSIYTFRKWSWMLRIGVWRFMDFGFPFGIILSLAVVGAIGWWRKIPAPVWLFLSFYPASIILVFAASRYRMPILPVMCVLAAGGCASVYRVFKERRWTKLAALIFIFLLVGLASGVVGPFHEEKLDYDAELHYALGVALEEKGDLERAKTSYLEAVRLRKDFVDAYYNLGVLMAEQKKFEEAMGYYSQAVEVDPDCASAHYNLGVLLQSQGRIEDAIKHYNQTLRVEPYDPYTHNNLGNALRSQGKLPEAINHYRLALKFKPDYAIAHSNLGYALLRQGSMDEAAEHFQKALKLRPLWPPALIGLARTLVTHPDLDKRNPEKAIFYAEQAAQLTNFQEPRILNILAMTYAAAGHFKKARLAAEKALELAVAAENYGLADRIRKRISLYQEGKSEQR